MNLQESHQLRRLDLAFENPVTRSVTINLRQTAIKVIRSGEGFIAQASGEEASGLFPAIAVLNLTMIGDRND